MTTTASNSSAGVYDRGREAAGPRGSVVLGNTWQLQHDPLAFLMSTAARYGDVARYRLGNVTFYQINHPDGVQRILQDNRHNYLKGDLFDIIRMVGGDGLFTSEGDLWLRQRRL